MAIEPNEILDWIDAQGVEYKQDDLPQKSVPKSFHHRTKKATEYRVDLHGLNVEGALRRLKRVFAEAKNQGCGQILIIHGRGNHSKGGRGKIKELVYNLLETEFQSVVVSYGFAPPQEGGGGATRVILK